MLTDITVGVVGRAHGVHGELYVDARTDEPQRRFAPGQVVQTQRPRQRRSGHDAPGQHGSDAAAVPSDLTIARSRQHHQRWLITFAEISDRETAESLRGNRLVCSVPDDEKPTGFEEYYDRQLVGLSVYTGNPPGETAGAEAAGTETAGTETAGPETAGRGAAGTVRSVLHHAGQDVLEVDVSGDIRLVPFVSSLVTDVDLSAQTLIVADVPGLLTDLDSADGGDSTSTATGGDSAGEGADRRARSLSKDENPVGADRDGRAEQDT